MERAAGQTLVLSQKARAGKSKRYFRFPARHMLPSLSRPTGGARQRFSRGCSPRRHLLCGFQDAFIIHLIFEKSRYPNTTKYESVRIYEYPNISHSYIRKIFVLRSITSKAPLQYTALQDSTKASPFPRWHRTRLFAPAPCLRYSAPLSQSPAATAGLLRAFLQKPEYPIVWNTPPPRPDVPRDLQNRERSAGNAMDIPWARCNQNTVLHPPNAGQCPNRHPACLFATESYQKGLPTIRPSRLVHDAHRQKSRP